MTVLRVWWCEDREEAYLPNEYFGQTIPFWCEFDPNNHKGCGFRLLVPDDKEES